MEKDALQMAGCASTTASPLSPTFNVGCLSGIRTHLAPPTDLHVWDRHVIHGKHTSTCAYVCSIEEAF